MSNFMELAKGRYSVRKYKDTPVEDEKINLILEAGRLAPTACNYQPQKIYVVKTPEVRAKLAELDACIFNAPVIFVIGYDDTVSAKGMICEGNDFGVIDCSIVCTHMMFEAYDIGLGSCWVGHFHEADVAKALGIPDNIRLRALLPVGYSADEAVPAHLHTEYRDFDETITIL